MKKILLQLFYFLSLSLGTNTVSKAQLVHIPDSAFRAYLNQNFGACMVGDSIDSNCPAVLAAKIINLSNLGITNLSGFEVFVNDTLLDCNGNQLTSLPALPSSLTFLNCYYNQITSLPTLPASLTTLVCAGNPLASLPNLPASLKHLDCSDIQLTALPNLPASLTSLYCRVNQLISLPSLPMSLIEIYCDQNQLNSLPTLPASLLFLNCSNNQLTSLPNFPSSLSDFQCDHNQITSMPLFPSSLSFLRCSFNQLTSIPVLPDSLFVLECENNQLTSLPAFPASLAQVNCSNNPLSCLPDLNQVDYLNFSSTQVNCLPGYGMLWSSTPSFIGFPICNVFNINGCDVFWNIEGSTFFDADTNCISGNTEPFLKNQKLNLYKNGVLDQQTYSNVNGDYDFDTFSYDFYNTKFDTTGLPFEVYCPSTGIYIDTISVLDSMKYDRDFGLKCKDVDLAVTNILSSILRLAKIQEIKIGAGDYTNYFGTHCANGISGTVIITITGACNYNSTVAGALTPNTVIGNVLTYNVADFGVLNFDSSFNFNILVDTTAALGSQICIQVSISTPSAELNYNNNLLSQCFTVVGSFDPNDKSAFPTSSMDISGDRWLTYLIRFQNTGTASAEHIFITDTLSTALDWSTFNLLSYSHQPLTQVYNDGLVKFSFPHINLPDSNTNEPASHGYVQYKIRAKDSLAIGSTIENTANIFFDFNAPVITNTTSNAVINCSIPRTIITASICNGDAYSLNGVLYYNDGTYQQKLITSVGCDSIIELQLSVNSINNTVSQSSAILQTAASGSGYQWIDCATNSAITSATNSTYQPTQSGNYAVAVTYGNCVDTSSCFAFSMVGLPSSIAADVIFQTRFNSNADNIQLHAEKLKGNKGVLRLIDISGRIIFQKQIENIAAGNLDVEIPAKGMNAGIYLVNLITERDNISGKVVKY